MGIGVFEVARPLFAFGDEFVLSRGQVTGIAVAVAVLVVGIIVAVIVRSQKKAAQRPMESCDKCGSMNVQHRAGLAVCMDCGHSVHAEKVHS